VPDARLAAPAVTAVTLLVTARVGGAYVPSTWGWVALGPALAAVAALALRRDVRVERSAAIFVGGLVLLAAWTALSALWTDSVPRTVLEVERDLVYLAAAMAIVALPRSRTWTAYALLGAIVAICCAGLVTRLFPAHFGLDDATGYRLARPLGYWNALGLLAAIGAVLATGVVADLRSRAVRAAGSAGLVVLLPTLFLTLSRGGWLALAAGVIVTVALHPHRLTYATATVVSALPAAAAVLATAHFHDLTDAPSSLDAATDAGRRLAATLALLGIAACLAPILTDRLRSAMPAVRRPPRAVLAALAIAACAACLAGIVVGGGRAYDAFQRPAPTDAGLRARLFTFSGHSRTAYWRVAANEYTAHPVLGSGAGTFDIFWVRHRTIGVGARDAHSLYLEALAELGPVGLLLLLATLASPFLALRARAATLVPSLAGGYVAFLAHATADWDWELPTVTLAGLLCGALLARSDPAPSRRLRAGWIALPAAAAAASLVAYVGNNALQTSERRLAEGNPAAAAASARTATRWAPWSADAWSKLGEAQAILGRRHESIESFRKAARKDPRDWFTWYRLAVATTGAERRAALVRVRLLDPLAPRLSY
jgi:tetratricopeptide (TPR) repeat protein